MHRQSGTRAAARAQAARVCFRARRFDVPGGDTQMEPVVRFNAGVLLHDSGRSSEALPHLRAAVESDASGAPRYRLALGRALVAAGDPAGAAEALRRAHAARPAEPGPLLELALALHEQDQSAPLLAATLPPTRVSKKRGHACFPRLPARFS